MQPEDIKFGQLWRVKNGQQLYWFVVSHPYKDCFGLPYLSIVHHSFAQDYLDKRKVPRIEIAVSEFLATQELVQEAPDAFPPCDCRKCAKARIDQ